MAKAKALFVVVAWIAAARTEAVSAEAARTDVVVRAAAASVDMPGAAGLVRRPVVTAAIPLAAALRQPDAPRTPTIQPVLPPPEDSIPQGGAAGQQGPTRIYGDTGIRPIHSLSINILPKGAGQVPSEANPTKILEAEFGSTEFRREPLNYSYNWESPGFWNQPLYFEQPNLERYGYSWGIAQPIISGAQFFVKIPLLPYMMTVHPPCEPIYSLGYYRPGSRAPYQINWPEVRLDAITVEAAFITGLCFLIP